MRQSSLLLIFLFGILTHTEAQRYFHKSEIIDVDILMKDILKNVSTSKYYDQTDFCAIVLLDSTYYPLILKLDTNLLNSKYYTCNYKIKNFPTNILLTNFKTITEFIFDDEGIQKYFSSETGSEFSYSNTIYIKGTTKAYIGISTNNGGADYRLELKDRSIIIEKVNMFEAYPGIK